MNDLTNKIKKVKNPNVEMFAVFNAHQNKINNAIQNFEKSQITRKGK
jgi:hypothetical protein